MKPDAIIRVRFLTPAEGGRANPIQGDRYGCPVMIESEGFDCRFVLDGPIHFDLGRTYDVAVKFLNPRLALKRLIEGKSVTLWEGKTIGEGRVLKVM